jgi:predicted transcriptional regulator
MAVRRRKTLKELLLELLKTPKTIDEVIKAVKSKRPRTRVRVIKALVSRLLREGSIKKVGDKLQA